MELFSLALGLCILAGVTANFVLTIRAERRRRRAEREARSAALAEAVEAASKMLGSALIGTSRGTAVPVDSPEGRALLLSAITGGPCSCRNCEESRRIAHAAEKRGES